MIACTDPNCFNPLRLPIMDYDFWPLKNGLILQNSKMFMIIFLKVPNERLGRGPSFCVEPNFQQCLIKSLLAKLKKRTNILSNKPDQPCQPLNIGDKILKIPLVSLVPKSVILCLSCLTSNLLKVFFSPQNSWSVDRPTAVAVAAKNRR